MMMMSIMMMMSMMMMMRRRRKIMMMRITSTAVHGRHMHSAGARVTCLINWFHLFFFLYSLFFIFNKLVSHLFVFVFSLISSSVFREGDREKSFIWLYKMIKSLEFEFECSKCANLRNRNHISLTERGCNPFGQADYDEFPQRKRHWW